MESVEAYGSEREPPADERAREQQADTMRESACVCESEKGR
jgi:hypothetical protein